MAFKFKIIHSTRNVVVLDQDFKSGLERTCLSA